MEIKDAQAFAALPIPCTVYRLTNEYSKPAGVETLEIVSGLDEEGHFQTAGSRYGRYLSNCLRRTFGGYEIGGLFTDRTEAEAALAERQAAFEADGGWQAYVRHEEEESRWYQEDERLLW